MIVFVLKFINQQDEYFSAAKKSFNAQTTDVHKLLMSTLNK